MSLPLKLLISLSAFVIGTIDLLAYKNYEKSEAWRKVGNVILMFRLVSDKNNLLTFALITYFIAMASLFSAIFGK